MLNLAATVTPGPADPGVKRNGNLAAAHTSLGGKGDASTHYSREQELPLPLKDERVVQPSARTGTSPGEPVSETLRRMGLDERRKFLREAVPR